jgi:hypothetical protein
MNVLFCRRQGLPGLPWCSGVPVRRAGRTGTVSLAVELIEGNGAGGEREPRPGRPDAAGLEDRAPGWPGCRPDTFGPRAIRGREADASPGSSSRPGFPAGGRTPVNVTVEPTGASRVAGDRRVRLPGASRPVVPSR